MKLFSDRIHVQLLHPASLKFHSLPKVQSRGVIPHFELFEVLIVVFSVSPLLKWNLAVRL